MTGLLETSSIGDVSGGTDGATPDWVAITELETDVTLTNADSGSLAYLINAKVRSKLKQTAKVASTDSAMIWDDRNNGLVNGYTPLVTNAVLSNLVKGTSTGVCSAIIFGNFADLVVGFWAGASFELIRDPSLAINGLHRMCAILHYDGGILRPQSFSAMQDALTT